MNASEIRDLLRKEVATVVFTKRDKSERMMHCTLMTEYLPEFDTNSSTSKPSEQIITVWDLEVNAWRSFRVDSILSINTDTVEYYVG